MTLKDAYQTDRLAISFELFPPKTPQGETNLYRHVGELMHFEPHLITCTYGAGGSTRDKTLEIVTEVKRRFACPVAAHLTCVDSSQDQLRTFLADAADAGVDNIVALRGDPPSGQSEFRPAPGGLRYASELVSLIREEFPRFGVAVAGYPEVHREAASAEIDLENLKHKVDCGADVVLTQLFYENDDFFRFRDACARAGIGAPIVPGLLPVTNLHQIKRITTMCGAHLPRRFISDLERQGDDEEGQFRVGVDFATRQAQGLIDAGVAGLHFYVLNKSQAAGRVLASVKHL